MSERPKLPRPFYIASVALEPKRWKSGRPMSFPFSSLINRLLPAGFDGCELFENHFIQADAAERQRLIESPLPVRILNSYYLPGLGSAEEAAAVGHAVTQLSGTLTGIKFNLGPKDGDATAQIDAALRWAETLPEQVTLLCECHPGTVLETPASAAAAFAKWPQERFAAIAHPVSSEKNFTINDWFDALGQRIAHLHFQFRDADNRMTSPAHVPDCAIRALQTINALNFSGSASLEFVAGIGHPQESPEFLLEQALADADWFAAHCS